MVFLSPEVAKRCAFGHARPPRVQDCKRRICCKSGRIGLPPKYLLVPTYPAFLSLQTVTDKGMEGSVGPIQIQNCITERRLATAVLHVPLHL